MCGTSVCIHAVHEGFSLRFLRHSCAACMATYEVVGKVRGLRSSTIQGTALLLYAAGHGLC